jgi:hypothetical protein
MAAQVAGVAGAGGQREEVDAQAVQLAAFVLLDHALGHERLQQTVRGGLREADGPRELGDAPAFGLHRGERADHRKHARHAAVEAAGPGCLPRSPLTCFHTLLLWNFARCLGHDISLNGIN